MLHGREWLLPVEGNIQDSIYIEDLALELVGDEVDKSRFGFITKSEYIKKVKQKRGGQKPPLLFFYSFIG